MPRVRYPLLALGLAALAAGVWAGLFRLGWSIPRGRANLVELHGPLMVFGFLGTVISLERAVALQRPWGYAAPAGTVAGTALLVAGVRQGVGALVLLHAGLAVRVAGDLAGNVELARWGGLLGAVAIALFLLATVASAAAGRLQARSRVRG